jgi:hypothetical protein
VTADVEVEADEVLERVLFDTKGKTVNLYS